jgi:hypothetical protein
MRRSRPAPWWQIALCALAFALWVCLKFSESDWHYADRVARHWCQRAHQLSGDATPTTKCTAPFVDASSVEVVP